MALTEDIYLPSDQELKVQEINVSSPVMRAAAVYLGKYCDDQCKEFMICRQEEKDPRRCLAEGKAVTACGLDFFYKVKDLCRTEVENYARCLEWNSADLRPEFCRKRQYEYDGCMKAKMGMDRPPFGYFTQVRLHKTDRPKPIPWEPEFPNQPVSLPDDMEFKDRPLHGSRKYFFP